MAGRKVMFQTALTDLKTTDIEGLGVLREDEFGKKYRWVKNASTLTALIAAGCCLMQVTSVEGASFKRVLSPNAIGTGPSTTLITMPAGVPIAAIGPSGSATGDHGWILVEGLKKVSMRQTATATNGNPGCHAIATTICVTNSEWAAPVTSVINSSGGSLDPRHVLIVDNTFGLTTGAATVASALVQVKCL